MKKILVIILVIIIIATLGMGFIGLNNIMKSHNKQNKQNEEIKKVVEKEQITTEQLNKILTNTNPYTITRKISEFQITREQQIKVNKQITKLKKEKENYLKRIMWVSNTFVDEFGDYTNKKYISQDYKNARFSNSATKNSQLEGRIIISKNSISFDSYEYGKIGNSSTTFIGSGYVTLRNSEHKTVLYSITNDLVLYQSDYSDLINFFKSSSGNVKIILKDSYKTSHYFEINVDGFSWNYKNNL